MMTANAGTARVAVGQGRDLRVTDAADDGRLLRGTAGGDARALMRILAGLLLPTEGRVSAGRHDLATQSGRQGLKAELGYLPQELGIYPELTARQFLDYVALLKGIDHAADRRRRVGELLEVVALTG